MIIIYSKMDSQIKTVGEITFYTSIFVFVMVSAIEFFVVSKRNSLVGFAMSSPHEININNIINKITLTTSPPALKCQYFPDLTEKYYH